MTSVNGMLNFLVNVRGHCACVVLGQPVAQSAMALCLLSTPFVRSCLCTPLPSKGGKRFLAMIDNTPCKATNRWCFSHWGRIVLAGIAAHVSQLAATLKHVSPVIAVCPGNIFPFDADFDCTARPYCCTELARQSTYAPVQPGAWFELR